MTNLYIFIPPEDWSIEAGDATVQLLLTTSFRSLLSVPGGGSESWGARGADPFNQNSVKSRA